MLALLIMKSLWESNHRALVTGLDWRLLDGPARIAKGMGDNNIGSEGAREINNL